MFTGDTLYYRGDFEKAQAFPFTNISKAENSEELEYAKIKIGKGNDDDINYGFWYTCGCASGPKVMVVEMENKGTSMKVPTPDWIKTYTASGISAVQSQFRDKYCVIGEETGVNKQFVLTWADNFSAQQRIGAMLRTNIASKYQAAVSGTAQSSGAANSSSAASTGSGDYQQEIENSINAVVNVSYSGAQREADWWSLSRRYDPDQKDVYTDEYTAYVLYTIPKAELNRQIAAALETSVSKDSRLYDITIALAQDILRNGVDYLSE